MNRLFVCFLIAATAFAASERILLTPQLLHRLQRERERQSPRWQAFEHRIETVPNSPERGFELALYYAITGNEKQGREAVAWGAAHPCDLRQTALILSWVGPLVGDALRRSFANPSCPAAPERFANLRDRLFVSEVRGTSTPDPPDLAFDSVPQGADLYALVEYLDTYRQMEGEDLRHKNRAFFLELPSLMLLSLPPQNLSHPSWLEHIAALALVDLDPNLESSQFAQGWAMEDRFTVREGSGVAYELLWADPYLPGVGYENMQPWAYDSEMHQLYARASWSTNACWIHISPAGVEQENCPEDWASAPSMFSNLVLQPVSAGCVNLSGLNEQQTMVVRTSRPNMPLRLYSSKNQQTVTSDAAGLWLVPKDHPERACLER